MEHQNKSKESWGSMQDERGGDSDSEIPSRVREARLLRSGLVWSPQILIYPTFSELVSLK